MYVDCSYESSCRAEYADGPNRCLRLLPGVGSRDLPARRAHSDLPTPGSDGRTTLLRARRQHHDWDWCIGSCDPLPVERGTISTEQAGFRGFGHAAIAIIVGVALGLAFYALQGAPSWNPVVLINAYAQVLVTSIAEIMVCWAVAGSVSQALLQDRGRWASVILAAIIASVLFGVYHFAHSPPFNTIPLAVILSVVGLLTSVFFFVSRDVYGTIAFHNFSGILGVIRALEASGNLSVFERPIIPLLVMAVIAVALLIAGHVLWLNSGTAPTPPRVR